MLFRSQSCELLFEYQYGHGVISTLFTCIIIAVYMYYNCSGESMENALRACCKGIKIGKILIHRVGDNGQQVRIEILYLVI
jgi:hypothetical protein